MKKKYKITLLSFAGFLLLFPLAVVLLVRYTDGTFSNGDQIILGYDEGTGQLQVFEQKRNRPGELDGPYVIGGQVIRVNEESGISMQPADTDSVLVAVGNESKDQFYVPLREDPAPPAWKYELPEKLMVIADIEGNFDGFSGFLERNGVVDENLRWRFGDGHMVLLGDFVDRGSQVIPTLWLIYKLEQEAERQGGGVHFILGNHEIMNIQGDFSYARSKYKKLAREIGKAEDPGNNYRVLFSTDALLGRWLRSKNIAEQIGDYLMVHAGISPEILPYDLPVPEMNRLVRANIDRVVPDPSKGHEALNFLMGNKGPYWYRGLVTATHYEEKITAEQLDRVLNKYGVKKIVAGHTIVEDVSTDFAGRVIRIDVKHGSQKNSGLTKGLLIENGVEFKVNDLGERAEISSVDDGAVLH